MRFSLVGPVYPFRGGIAHYTARLCQALAERGHAWRLFSFTRLYPRRLFPGATDRDTSQVGLTVPATYTLDTLNPLTWWATAAAVRAEQPQVVVLQWWVPFLAPVWAALAQWTRGEGRRVVFVCHNVLPHERRAWDTGLARLALGPADGFVVQSQGEAEQLRRLRPGRPLAVVPHPVYDVLAQQPADRAQARQKLGLPEAAPVLLFFGFVRAYKGLAVLLEALPAIRAQLRQARLLVVGEFWHDKPAYLDQITRLGLTDCVTLVDRYVPNEALPEYFAAGDVVVLPYTHATQSGVVQLAYGFGRPVITTRVGGLPEAVREGETGLLVAPDDPAALAEAVVRFFRDGLAEPLTAGVRAHAGNPRWDALVDALEQLAGPASG